AAPFVCDWNHDGQKDLIVGNENGLCLLFPNTSSAIGTPTLGTATILNNTSGDIDVGKFARPWIVDYNRDWMDDLIIGNGDGDIRVYLNIGNEQKPEYGYGENIQPDNANIGQCAAPCITDWGNNGTLTLLSGHKEGFIWSFVSSPSTALLPVDESISIRAGVCDWPAFRYDANRSGNDPSEALLPQLELYWTYPAGSPIVTSPVILGDALGFCSKDGVVHVVKIGTPDSNPQKIDTSFDSTPIMIGEFIYIAGHDGIIRCLRWTTQEEVWTYQTGGSIQWSSPMIVNGRLYIGCSDGRLYCLNASSGEFRGEFLWSYKTAGIIESSPTVAGGKVYFGSMDGRVYCIDAVNGALKWEYNIGSAIRSTACIKNNTLYIVADNGMVYAIRTDTGKLLWSYTASIGSSPAIDKDTLYLGGEDRIFYALNALTGNVRWSYYIGSPIHSSPIVANGIVYVGADNGNIYALNPDAISRDRVVWNYQTNGKILSSPAAAGSRLFVTSEDGNCYVFGPKRFLGSSKTASVNGSVPPGDAVNYTITIINPADIGTISVIDVLDASLIVDPAKISNNGTLTTQNGQMVISWNDINPQSTCTLSFGVNVSPDAAPGAIINNTARIEWIIDSSPGSFTIPAVSIRVSGTVTAIKVMIPNKQEVSPGETIEYALICKNITGATIHKLTITDVIDPELTAVVPLNNGVYDTKNRRITWQINTDIANGKEVSVRFRAKIASTAQNGIIITNDTASFWSIDTGTGTITAEPAMVTVTA
ncbi:MAG: PQQ-binding-like beta-propeller repeat protein, partial [Candidatus Desantisbacteria bacterium]